MTLDFFCLESRKPRRFPSQIILGGLESGGLLKIDMLLLVSIQNVLKAF